MRSALGRWAELRAPRRQSHDEIDAGGALAVRCASTFAGTTLPLESPIDSRATGTRVGLRMRGSSARFDYVVIGER
ncbi:MAG: hypothetical protein ACKV2T_16175 [Kofleriaceae bacterium]